MDISFWLQSRHSTAVRAWCQRAPLPCSNTAGTAQCKRRISVQRIKPYIHKCSNEFIETQHHDAAIMPGISPFTAAPALGLASLHYLATTGNAYAAKVCLDVPDWIVDFDVKDALFHSPVVAIGAAVLALLLFPKLIKFSINYLALPAIIALLAWLAVSHPQQSANTVYTILEFIKEHPAASSIGIIAAAGVILGPDLLAGAAVAGVAALLAVQAGVLQLPTPQLPRLLGQQLVEQQVDKAGRMIKQKISSLDDADLAVSSRLKQQRRDPPDADAKPLSPSLYDASSSSSSSSSGGSSSNQVQMTPPLLPVVTDGPKEATAAEQLQQHPAAEQQTAPSGQLQPPSTAASNLKSLGFGLGSKLGQAGRGLADKARDMLPSHLPFIPESPGSNMESSKEAGGRQVQQASEGLHQLLDEGSKSPIGQGLGSAVQGIAGHLQGLGTRVHGLSEQTSESQLMQSLRNRATAAGAGMLGTARDAAGVLQGNFFLQQQQQPPAVHGGSGSGDSVTIDMQSNPQPARTVTANDSEVDTILANS